MAKASKRLHILRVLKRSGIPPANLLKVDFALIRSVLEYCCPVWHNALHVKLPDSIERVQKRALRINFPAPHYQEALATTSCSNDSVAGARPLLSQQRQAIPYTLPNALNEAFFRRCAFMLVACNLGTYGNSMYNLIYISSF